MQFQIVRNTVMGQRVTGGGGGEDKRFVQNIQANENKEGNLKKVLKDLRKEVRGSGRANAKAMDMKVFSLERFLHFLKFM